MDETRESEREPERASGLTARYEIGDDESPSLALITVLSTLTGVDETEMRSLYTHVDLEAIDAFLASTAGPTFWSGSVQLELNGSVLFVNRDAIAVMADPARRDASE